MPILIVFFLMITAASLLVPYPLFPGNLLSALIASVIGAYVQFFSAIFNGLFYGVISWLVFATLSKRLEE